MFAAFTNAIIYTGTEVVTGKALLVEEEQISAIIDHELIPSGTRIIDCGGDCIAPGLIDLQIAGGGGYLFSDRPSAQAMNAMADSIIKSGTTGFLIALPSNSHEVYLEAIRVIKENPHPAVLGLHLEGPYISLAGAGAHMKKHIRPPDLNEVKTLLKEAGGIIRMMTLAPEVCSGDIIKLLADNGIVVAAGHSHATFEEAVTGFRNGISTVTHLFNAMSQLHHRDPGLPGAVMLTEGAFASIIADGIHVHYDMLAIVKKIMRERLFLVSDAVEETVNGAYPHVRKKDRFTLPDGTLSGSSLSLIEAVGNCVRYARISTDEALRMASAYPARLIKESNKGMIAPGYAADLTVFDKDFTVTGVFINGADQLKKA
ncbi:MAG: N-acetylglucosamine-6-phosphate deacetylase [Bacteroidales bacterium]|nr:N-acetylglucosamine-6-phosphate deacetylase [Bacteroidales bacterium]